MSSTIPELLDEYNDSESVEEKVVLLNEISWAYYYVNLDSMFFYAKKSEELNQNISKKELATTFNYFGIYFESQVKPNLALENYLRALQIQKSIKDSSGLAFTHTNLGWFYYSQHENEKAVLEHQRSLEINREIDDSLSMANNYQAIALCYTYIDSVDLDLSLQLYEKAAIIYQMYDDDYYLMSVYINMAKIFFENNDLRKSEEYYSKAEKIADESGNLRELRAIFFGKAAIFSKRNNYSKAIQFLRRSTVYAEGLKNIEILKYHYDFFSELFEKNGQLDSALLYLKKSNSIKDSLFTIETNEKIASINAKYETEKKDKEILVSQLEISKVKRENSKTRSNYKVLSILFILIIIILLGIVLLYFYKIKHNRILAEKNDIILRNLDEKEVLLGEIHHRVKNNLQLVSTMLKFQLEGVNDPEFVKIIEESRGRIQAMALIHQELYSHDSLSGINMKEYLKSLISKLLMAYSVEEVLIEYQIDDIAIKLNTAIPIALIVNELFTNSIKYAFDGIEEPAIEVYLKEEKDVLQLILSDNGNGYESNVKSDSFGSKLVKSFCRQLNAEMTVDSTTNGTITMIKIKRYEKIT